MLVTANQHLETPRDTPRPRMGLEGVWPATSSSRVAAYTGHFRRKMLDVAVFT
jgi:hypothetical protein